MFWTFYITVHPMQGGSWLDDENYAQIPWVVFFSPYEFQKQNICLKLKKTEVHYEMQVFRFTKLVNVFMGDLINQFKELCSFVFSRLKFWSLLKISSNQSDKFIPVVIFNLIFFFPWFYFFFCVCVLRDCSFKVHRISFNSKMFVGCNLQKLKC